MTDLVKYAYGFDPYDAFFDDREIDWGAIWKNRKDKLYAFVLGYNAKNVDLKKFKPDRQKFLSLFPNILNSYHLDELTNPVFCIAFIETKNKKELDLLLDLNFENFFSKR